VGVFLVCFVCIQGFPLFFRNYFTPERWTNGKFIVFSLTIVTLFTLLDTFVLSIYIDDLEKVPYYSSLPVFQRFFMFFKAAALASILPIAIIHYVLQRKDIEQEAPETPVPAVEHTAPANGGEEEEAPLDCSDIIELSGRLTKDCIRLLPEDILYAKTSGNYTAVYYLKNGKEDHKLLRTSMNELGDSLNDYPYIIRCHRAFMVNIQQMAKIQGNLSGYNIELKNINAKVPVSKSYTRIVKEKIMLHTGIDI
jgi:hypothetical protein